MKKRKFLPGVLFLIVGIGTMVFAFGGMYWFGNGGVFSENSSITLNASSLSELETVPSTGVIVDAKTNTVKFTGSKIIIPIIASPENGPMYSFGIYGLVNPTIVVRRSTEVRLLFVNGDNDMYHGVVVTAGAPPYPYMGMMMFDNPAFGNSFVPPLPPESSGKYTGASAIFDASQAGSFYYICQVPGHAADGMYGRFLVEN